MTALPQAERRSRLSAKWAPIVLLLLPALALYLLFVFVPVIQAMYFSLFKWNGLKPLTDFIGLDNYARAIQNNVFQHAVLNNAFVIFFSLVIQIPFSLALAIYLNHRFPGRTIFRVIFFLPYVISEVITAILFYQLMDPNSGAMDAVMKWAGLGGLIQDWWGDETVVMYTLFAVITWKYFGYHMLLLLAGLQGIPHEVQEAALIDGAGRWQSFRYITLPLLGPTLRVSVFLSIIGSLQLFAMVWVTTRGGPGAASHTMATYMFDFGMKRSQMGYGSAVAVILFAICFVFALLYQRYVLHRDVEGAITAYNG